MANANCEFSTRVKEAEVLISCFVRREHQLSLRGKNVIYFEADLSFAARANTFNNVEVQTVERNSVNIISICDTNVSQSSTLNIVEDTCSEIVVEAFVRETSVNNVWCLTSHISLSVDSFRVSCVQVS